MVRGGNFGLGSISLVSPVHPELGLGWIVKLLIEKNQVKFDLTRLNLGEGRGGLLYFSFEKTRPISVRLDVNPIQLSPSARIATSTYDMDFFNIYDNFLRTR